MTDQRIRDGGCHCGAIRFRMTGEPMFVHCCHCTVCQRQGGSAFAVNAIIETDRMELLQGAPEMVLMDSPSGAGQKIARCPTCEVAVWSHYLRITEAVSYVRLGAFDEATSISPSIHIFTSTMHPWVGIPPGVPIKEEFYDRAEEWPAESLERLKIALGA